MGEKIKTYNDSFLYKSKIINGNKNDENKNNKTIKDYIINSMRIDKNSPSFTGIIEDIKRRQTSSVVYKILMMDCVHLCINSYEMPRSFKVLDVKDLKNGKSNAIFIDCTGLIEYRNGFFICNKIDVLITYLYDALVYLLYRNAHTRMMNNSDIILSSASCYNALFNYVIDYMRPVGYSENKKKISYFVILFYLNSLMGKDIDNYSKNIAAKISGIELKNISAYDLYIEDGMFDNIDTFISSIAKTFDIKGLNTNVFLSRWIYLVGNGTQYAIELFTSFGVVLCSAYSGSYVVNQKQIEKTCGVHMVKFNNAIRSLGESTFSSIYSENIEYHDLDTVKLAYALEERTNAPKVKKQDFASIDEAVKLIDSYKRFYAYTHQEKLLPKAVLDVFNTGLTVLESYVKDSSTAYQEGALCACSDEVKKLIKNTPEVNKIIMLLNDKILICQEAMSNDKLSSDDQMRAAKCLVELRQIKNNI